MLRRLLLYLSSAPWAQKLVTGWGVARRVALRFVAGETEDDAIAAVRAINAKGMTVTLDLLGESITDAASARAIAAEYAALIERIAAEGLDSWVSVKLTALGLDIDAELAYENMCTILSAAQPHDIRVTIDMEDSSVTQTTLDLLTRLHEKEGFTHVRGVIQAYLYRSEGDIAMLTDHDIGVRLCKGAYREPASVAFPKKADVDANYVALTHTLLEAAAQGHGYPGIATHDEDMISAAQAHAAELELGPECYEFQMLYGVRATLQEQLTEAGYEMRVYVPYGTAWYPYFMRRLAERPANLWFFASNFFRR
jgi:proline dehydrogenase